MSVSHNNTSIITDDLVLYIDVNNPKCVDASLDITSSTKLKNLAVQIFKRIIVSLEMLPNYVTDHSIIRWVRALRVFGTDTQKLLKQVFAICILAQRSDFFEQGDDSEPGWLSCREYALLQG